jgi:hypothetical protein
MSKTNGHPPAAAPSSVSDKLDKGLVAQALRKVAQGEEPTPKERAALRKYETKQEETRRWQYYASIPQKHWREMSGRQTKVLNEQASRYGIPFGGATVSLPDVVRALHDLLAANAVKLNGDDDALLQGDGSPALERYREERAALARMDRLERERVLVRRDEVREGLGRIATIIREAGQSLQRQYGTDAAQILFEAMDEAGREVDRWLKEQNAGGG